MICDLHSNFFKCHQGPTLRKNSFHRHPPKNHCSNLHNWRVPQGRHNGGFWVECITATKHIRVHAARNWTAGPEVKFSTFYFHVPAGPSLRTLDTWKYRDLFASLSPQERGAPWELSLRLSQLSYPSLAGCLTHSSNSVNIWMNVMGISVCL